jgi:hypothetical protein
MTLQIPDPSVRRRHADCEFSLVYERRHRMPTKRRSHGRELLNTGRDKRYVRRDDKGRFNESDDQGKSLSQDRRKHAKTTVKAGQGDRGDQKRR